MDSIILTKPKTFYQSYGKYILIVIFIILAWELLQYWLTPREVIYINKPTGHTVSEIDKEYIENKKVDCQVSEWGEWSECDKECGGGQRTKTRTIVRPAENGGIPCEVLETTGSCNLDECPIEEFSNKIL